jgi:hypothetical protein
MRTVDAEKNIYEMMSNWFGKLDPTYDPTNDPLPQYIFRRHELSIADHLMSFRDDLVRDFLKEYGSLEEAITSVGRNVIQKKADRTPYLFDSPDATGNRFPDDIEELVRRSLSDTDSERNPSGWKNVEFKYHDPYNNIHWDIDRNLLETRYPTACKILDEFGDDCPICSYSYLGPKTSIHRHTGPENRDGEYIRIHIPLIVPEGDLFFEVNGDEVNWDDIFAFDNQFAHSAHNLSDGHRLIFLFDVRRARIGLPPGEKWNKNRQLYAMSQPFVRKDR